MCRQHLQTSKTVSKKIIAWLLLIIATSGWLLMGWSPLIQNHQALADPANPADGANFTMNPAKDILACAGQSECFAFSVDTRLLKDGTTNGTDTTFSIPTSSRVGSDYDDYYWIINWGDGSADQTEYGRSNSLHPGIPHTYPAAGKYQITIRPVDASSNGWFDAFGFSQYAAGSDSHDNKYKFLSIDTPFTNLMRTQGDTSRFAYMFYEARNCLGIPTELFANISTTSSTDLSYMFYYTFYFFAYNSLAATLPDGLFSSLDTSSATNLSSMFSYTFSSYAYNSTTATIPTGLFNSINTSSATDLSNLFSGTFLSYANKSTTATIPAGLFDSINTSNATDLSSIFSGTFLSYANESTIATIPAGLFDSIVTPSGANMSHMFSQTFQSCAVRSTVATIPAGLFDSLDTSSASDLSYMFNSTFDEYALYYSATATIPDGLFSSIKTDKAIKLDSMFHETFRYYTRRQVTFSINGSVVSDLSQTFINPYATKVGADGVPSDNPTVTAGDEVYPTYRSLTITKPTDAYTNYNWHRTDGTSCTVANPTADCGDQDSNSLIVFPVTDEYAPSVSTEKGNVTYYGVPVVTPTVTSVSPAKGVTDETGQVITITGSHFTGATAVTVGGAACVSFTVTNDTTISCTLPNFSVAGQKSVIVNTPEGTNTPNDLYEVVAKYITMSTSAGPSISVRSGRFSSGVSAVTVSTNNPNGYRLTMKSSSTNLTRTTTPISAIPTIGGTPTPYTPNTPASSSIINSLIDKKPFWAYRVTGLGSFGASTSQETNTATTAYSWASVPTADTIIRTGSMTDDLTANTPQKTDTWFAISPTITTAAGQYQAIITYTAVYQP